jgi:integrase
MNDHFKQLYRDATTNRQRREICRAALVNILAWLGWLRAGETFSLRWEDITMTEPRDSPTLGLPAHTGTARLRLSEQTKSDRTQTA